MNLPLLFSFADLFIGNGFAAGVRMNGTAFLDPSDGEVWISGVAPAGFAGGGLDRGQAFTQFKNAWQLVLVDIASESVDFAQFKRLASEFFSGRSEHLQRDWDEALRCVREGNVKDATLPSRAADSAKPAFEIVELDMNQLDPSQNNTDEGLSAAA